MSIPNQNRQFEYLHAEQASAWLEILRNPTPEQCEAFIAWVKQSPLNVREILLAQTLDQALDQLDSEGKYNIASLLAQAEPQVVQLHQHSNTLPPPTTKKRSWLRLRIAAGLMIALTVGWAWLAQQHSAWKEFQTGIGEQRGFELDDGSVIQLNTHSHVALRYSKQVREIRLLAGEALFRVHHDPTRPFLVSTHDAVIRAVGTQFNVYERSDATLVAVLEGRVSVATETGIESAAASGARNNHDAVSAPCISLGISEEAQISHAGTVTVRTVPDISEAVAWQQRRLVFHEQTLDRIAEEFNRYSRRQIRLEGTGIGDRRYSGVFDVDDPESLAQILTLDSTLSVKSSERLIVVKAR